jgi:hypothetical protein
MLNHVHVNTGPQQAVEIFAPYPFYNLLNRKIRGARVFSVEQGCGNPNFVSNSQCGA